MFDWMTGLPRLSEAGHSLSPPLSLSFAKVDIRGCMGSNKFLYNFHCTGPGDAQHSWAEEALTNGLPIVLTNTVCLESDAAGSRTI